MKDFSWEDFKNYKCAVHCKTEEEAEKFLSFAKRQGLKWCCSGQLNKTYWNYNKTNTYYVCNFYLMYGSIFENYKDLPIFDFSDIYNKLRYSLGEAKSYYPIDLIEDGMVVETADLKRYLVMTKDNQRILINCYMYIPFDRYNEELHYYNSATKFPVSNLDIIAIYKMSCNTLGYLFDDDEEKFQEQTKVVWEREEIEFMTLEQVCKELGKKIKIKED